MPNKLRNNRVITTNTLNRSTVSTFKQKATIMTFLDAEQTVLLKTYKGIIFKNYRIHSLSLNV